MTINAAIYRAAGFFQEDCQSELQRANFLPVVADLQLDALLKLARFLGSIQEGGYSAAIKFDHSPNSAPP